MILDTRLMSTSSSSPPTDTRLMSTSASSPPTDTIFPRPASENSLSPSQSGAGAKDSSRQLAPPRPAAASGAELAADQPWGGEGASKMSPISRPSSKITRMSSPGFQWRVRGLVRAALLDDSGQTNACCALLVTPTRGPERLEGCAQPPHQQERTRPEVDRISPPSGRCDSV